MQQIKICELEQFDMYCLIDVRTAKQYYDGHLKGAHHVPLVHEQLHYQLYDTYHRKGIVFVLIESLPHIPHFWQYIQKLRVIAIQEQTKPIIIYCSRARFRSKIAYYIMLCFHKQTYILSGGIKGISTKAYEALCPRCGIEHLFNELEIENTDGKVHCKKCGELIQLYKSNKGTI